MKKLFATLLLLAGCSRLIPGEVAIQVTLNASPENQYHVIHGGWLVPGVQTDYYTLPTVEQRAVWAASTHEGSKVDESISFNGKDGQPVNVDVGAGYMLSEDDEAIIRMVRTYGRDINAVMHGRVRDSVRSAFNSCASHLSVEQIYGESKDELLTCAHQRVSAEYEPNGLKITRLSLNSEIRLPEQVKVAMAGAIAATQNATRAQNELALAQAEGAKVVATATAQAEATLAQARAQAEANEVLNRSLTPQLIELKRIEVDARRAEKWNGQLPTTTLGGQTLFNLD